MADERDELDEAIYCLEWKEAMEPGCTWERTERARSIRARERKLAELAHAMAAHLDVANRALTEYENQWTERYEEAVK